MVKRYKPTAQSSCYLIDNMQQALTGELHEGVLTTGMLYTQTYFIICGMSRD